MEHAMAGREDAIALRRVLRTVYLTEERACCHPLLGMSFVHFEHACLLAARQPGGGPLCRAQLADGVRLEYRAHSVVVRLAGAAAGASCGKHPRGSQTTKHKHHTHKWYLRRAGRAAMNCKTKLDIPEIVVMLVHPLNIAGLSADIDWTADARGLVTLLFCGVKAFPEEDCKTALSHMRQNMFPYQEGDGPIETRSFY